MNVDVKVRSESSDTSRGSHALVSQCPFPVEMPLTTQKTHKKKTAFRLEKVIASTSCQLRMLQQKTVHVTDSRPQKPGNQIPIVVTSSHKQDGDGMAGLDCPASVESTRGSRDQNFQPLLRMCVKHT